MEKQEKLQELSKVEEKPEVFVSNEKNDDFTFNIIEKVGVMSISPSGWSKEINVVSWNGNKAKYDIRDWSADHERMTRGIRLTKYEAKKLRDALNAADLDALLKTEDAAPEVNFTQ